MLNKYFNKRFKTLGGVKFAILLKRPYDWVQLKWNGENIVSQKYSFFDHSSVSKITDSNGRVLNTDGYTITNIVWTQSMVDDIETLPNIDVIDILVKELKTKE